TKYWETLNGRNIKTMVGGHRQPVTQLPRYPGLKGRDKSMMVSSHEFQGYPWLPAPVGFIGYE
ncbi:hypothetical protein, partial [Cecembia sp.]|uniref:hypothetical protein n=1 Tax=Cecembia sp. TaxID=1898110 RepID=UPI0025BD4A91